MNSWFNTCADSIVGLDKYRNDEEVVDWQASKGTLKRHFAGIPDHEESVIKWEDMREQRLGPSHG